MYILLLKILLPFNDIQQISNEIEILSNQKIWKKYMNIKSNSVNKISKMR